MIDLSLQESILGLHGWARGGLWLPLGWTQGRISIMFMWGRDAVWTRELSGVGVGWGCWFILTYLLVNVDVALGLRDTTGAHFSVPSHWRVCTFRESGSPRSLWATVFHRSLGLQYGRGPNYLLLGILGPVLIKIYYQVLWRYKWSLNFNSFYRKSH